MMAGYDDGTFAKMRGTVSEFATRVSQLPNAPANPSGIIPMDLRVLILPDKIEERTKGGIILTEKVIEKGEYAQCKATIVALGENAFAEAERSAIERGVAYRRPAPGDRILIALYGGTRPEGKDGVTYRLVNDEDIVARLED